jgi:hypothetical protein
MRAIFGGMAVGIPAAFALGIFAGLAAWLPTWPWMVAVAALAGAIACLIAILPLGDLRENIGFAPYAILD